MDAILDEAARMIVAGKDDYNRGLLNDALDKFQTALRMLQTTRQALQNLGRPTPKDLLLLLGASHSHVGGVYSAKGDLALALHHYQQALAISEDVDPNSPQTARDYQNVGSIHQARGDLELALAYYQKALGIIQQVAPNSSIHAAILNNIGTVYQKQGNFAEAIKHYQQAIGITREFVLNYCSFLSNLGIALFGQGRLRQAQEDWEQAFDCFMRSMVISLAIAPGSLHIVGQLNNLGYVCQARGELEQAREYYEKALSIVEQVAPNSRECATILGNIGFMYEAQGDLYRAIEYFEQAVQVIESLRTRAGGARAKEQLFAQYQNPYQALIACLYERNLPDDHTHAFHYAERSRARTLLELLAERHIEIRAETEEQRQLLNKRENLQFRLAKIYDDLKELRSRREPPGELIRQLEQEQRDLESEFDRVEDQIRKVFPEYSQIQNPEPMTLEDVQQKVLDPSVLLLEYAIAGDGAFVWAVRQDRFVMVRLPRAGDELTALAAMAVGRYHVEDSSEDIQPLAQAMERVAGEQLYDALIKVVPAELWEGVSRLIVIPDGALYYLPFEILPLEDGALLGERYPIVYAPSATVLHELRTRLDRRPAYEGEFVGFAPVEFASEASAENAPRPESEKTPPAEPEGNGDSTRENPNREAARRFALRGRQLSPLSASQDEVLAIRSMFGERGVVYLREQATEHRAKTATRGYRYVHFSTHGLLDDQNPLYSGLALSPPLPDEPQPADDILQVWEMFGLKLDAELVVLSACQTGLGAIRGGEGLVGMSRALFFAGAQCLVVSLWSVPNLETAHLMQWFYEELGKGLSIVEALRAAKARMHEATADPYFWAGFVVIGLGW